MTERVLGPTGSPRRRWTLLLPLVAALALGLFYIAGAQAVHDIGVFQLDGNAQTSDNPAPTALEDWDLICKAHQPSSTPAGSCVFNSSFIPAGSTVALPSQFIVDPSESSQDDILKGGTKDDSDVSSWKWASAKPSPPKNDVTDGYAAEYTCKGSASNSVAGCTGTTGDKLLYFGADRFSNNGSANIAFWFFQNQITQKLADGTTDAEPGDECTLGAGCAFGGVHKVGNVSLGGTTPGDILIISAFGPKAQIFVYEWVGPGNATKDYLGSNQCFTSVCTLQPLFIGGLDSDCPSVTNDKACALANAVSKPSPWVLPQAGQDPDNTFAPTNLFEGGVNLTQLGLAGACFSSFLINTRASAAGDAELHDKILGQFERCVPALTTQASTNGTVTPGTPVTDRATVTVTGATSPDDALGTVQFYLCGPIASGGCTVTTNPIGSPVTLSNAACSPVSPNSTDGISCAVSPSVNDSGQTGNRGPLAPGRYCFRASANLTNYDDPADFTNDTTECFRVADTSSMTTAQNWLPNDSATVTSGGGTALNGSVVFTLYDGAITCATPGSATVLYTETKTLSSAASPATVSTGNTATKILVANNRTVTWQVVFTSSDSGVSSPSGPTCETTVLTITN